MTVRPVVRHAVVVTLAGALSVVACDRGPPITCRVNEVCFVCPNEREKAACKRDPASSRCKWAPPDTCKT